jgi:hypothetical protein
MKKNKSYTPTQFLPQPITLVFVTVFVTVFVVVFVVVFGLASRSRLAAFAAASMYPAAFCVSSADDLGIWLLDTIFNM